MHAQGTQIATAWLLSIPYVQHVLDVDALRGGGEKDMDDRRSDPLAFVLLWRPGIIQSSLNGVAHVQTAVLRA